MNKLVLNGQVVEVSPLRYTPAGIPLLSFAIKHVSEVIEAGLKRQVEYEIAALTIGELAKIPIQVGSKIKASGFLAKRSVKSTQLVIHVQKIALNDE